MTTTRILQATPIQTTPPRSFSLDLSHRHMRDSYAGVKTELAVISLEKKVTELSGKELEADIDLSGNYLGFEAAQALAEWLESGDAPARTALHLLANKLDDKAAKLLAKASSSPKAPRHLTISLGTNEITDVGAGYWAQALKEGDSELMLSLTSNFITEKGASELEAAQKVARRDLVLNLAGNLLNVAKRDSEREGNVQSVENFRRSHYGF